MPWTVIWIAALCYGAGLATANGRFTLAGVLVVSATATALVLRWYVLASIRQAFAEGAGYGTSVRRRVRGLPEAHEVPDMTRQPWLNGSRGGKKQPTDPEDRES